MIEKMKNGKWHNAIVTPEAFNNKMEEIREAVDRFGFNERKVCMYSTWEKVGKLLEGWKDFEGCTFSSKKVLISEVNGLIDILNAWIEYEQEPKVKVRFKNGNIKAVAESTARDYIECGLAEAIIVWYVVKNGSIIFAGNEEECGRIIARDKSGELELYKEEAEEDD